MTMDPKMKTEQRDHYVRTAAITLAFVVCVLAWFFNINPAREGAIEGALLVLVPAVMDVWRVQRRHKKVERESLRPPAR